MATPTDADDWQAVESVADFVRFAELLAEEYAEDERQVEAQRAAGHLLAEGTWAQGTPGAWMEALAAWMVGRYLDAGKADLRSEIEPPSWRTFAYLLSASRLYE
ncbi:hypothetical protein [Micromonospora sp. DT47]|uniref:hypothetical protein n=1 Tax=Micromonospora sp. DT47 TaxID=3393431 RepID=UPI003CF955A6